MRITPERVTALRPDEVFVFGSNAEGHHGRGAPLIAHRDFGAAWGEGHGYHGDAYAIDTMSGLEVLAAEARTFAEYSAAHVERLGLPRTPKAPAERGPSQSRRRRADQP